MINKNFLKSIIRTGVQKYQYMRSKSICLKSPYKLIVKLYNKNFVDKINLINPSTFNEKLQWLKLYWFDDRAQQCCDKYLVRDYVKKKGLGHILNELYAIYNSIEEINLSLLPEKFVLKLTHDSGSIAICNRKDQFDFDKAKSKLNANLKVDYEFLGGEWPYHSDNKRIICEKYLEDTIVDELYDYKFFCFNGKPECIFLCSDRANGHPKSNFYDINWNKLPFRWIYEPSEIEFSAPSKLKEMLMYAEVLADNFPFVRVDFYQIGDQVIFGELTFFHGSGTGSFTPHEVDEELGSKIKLPIKQNPWKYIIK